jgi:hypothetical protein
MHTLWPIIAFFGSLAAVLAAITEVEKEGKRRDNGKD